MEIAMFEWEESFEPHILERGWNYAMNGSVRDLRQNGDQIEAIVEGSEYYKVRVEYDGHSINKPYCSCPYAAKGAMCKHMAAVLYAVDENRRGQGVEQGKLASDGFGLRSDDAIPSIDQLLRDADRKQLENVLLLLANADDKTKNRIRALLAGVRSKGEAGEVSEPDFESDIDRLFEVYTDWDGYINYHQMFELAGDLEVYLKNQTKALIEEGQWMTALEVTIYALECLGEYDMDDDGELDQISRVCYSIWQNIVADCPGEVKEQIREQFEEYYDDGIMMETLEFVLEDFLKYELATPAELEEQIHELDAMVEGGNGVNDTNGSSGEIGSNGMISPTGGAKISVTKCPTVFTFYYGYAVEAIELRMILMRKLGKTEEEVDAYRRKYLRFESVRRYYLEKAKTEGNTEEEIRLLQVSKELDTDSIRLRTTYADRLIELYHSLGDLEREKAERKERFLMDPMAPVEVFRKYREMCTEEEWKKERDALIATRTVRDKQYDLLAEEKLYAELYEGIMKEEDRISYLNKYGFLLIETYSEPILEIYKAHVNRIAEDARNRKAYEGMVRHLRRMREYKGGEEMTREMCKEWIEKYTKRKAMVEELEKYLGEKCGSQG